MNALGPVNTSDSVTHCIPRGFTERCFHPQQPCLNVLIHQTINKASLGPPAHSQQLLVAVSVCWWMQMMSARANYCLSQLTPSRLRLQMILIVVSLTWWLAVSDTFTSRDPDRTAYQLVPMSPCLYTAGKQSESINTDLQITEEFLISMTGQLLLFINVTCGSYCLIR